MAGGEHSWSTGVYSNNTDIQQTLSDAGAEALLVHVSGATEANYDYLYLYDANDQLLKTYHGVINQTFVTYGSLVRARLVTDHSVTASGVDVTVASARWTTGSYGNNQDRSYVFSVPELSQLRINISGETEAGYDFILIYDENNQQVKELDGLLNENVAVSGSSVRIRLKTDGSITRSGVVVTLLP